MVKTTFSIILVALLTFGISILTPQNNAFSQDNVSLGCCKTVEDNPVCVGCGEGGSNCSIDGSLCDEYHSFTLDEVCVEDSIEGAVCRPSTTTGCCVSSLEKCEDGVEFTTCGGQHWFEGAACDDVPLCKPASASNFTDRIIIVLAVVVVVALLIMYRRKKPAV